MRMCYIPTQKVVVQKLYEGRNYEWFDELQERGYRPEYDDFPVQYGLPEYASIDDKNIQDQAPGNGYYGFAMIQVSKLLEWYAERQPALHAGWVRKIDQWNYERKNIIPNEVYNHLPVGENIEDWCFIEYIDSYDPMTTVLRSIKAAIKEVGDANSDNYIIYYFFDC